MIIIKPKNGCCLTNGGRFEGLLLFSLIMTISFEIVFIF